MSEARGFEGTGVSGTDLDNHITGHWGEDQFPDDDPKCEGCMAYDECNDPPEECGGPFDSLVDFHNEDRDER
jgi:hypothetical protein